MGMGVPELNLFGHMTVIRKHHAVAHRTTGQKQAGGHTTKGYGCCWQWVLPKRRLTTRTSSPAGRSSAWPSPAHWLWIGLILLDEPTSALDPTMVGEVQAVIGNWPGAAKTMMIVTHEMNFARAISNRVFYMDEGGIYEDGTPEQIFDHPQRENTRRFVQN